MAPTSTARGERHSRSERETEFARIVAFTDGVFAVAITLLVLKLDVPNLPSGLEPRISEELLRLWPTFLSYLLSFAVIGRFWVAHHRFFGTLDGFDARLMNLNLLNLSLIVLIPFTTEVLDDYGEQPAAPILYASVLAAASLVNWAMVHHAHRAGLVRDSGDRPGHSGLVVGTAVIFLASIPLALIAPSYAPLVWIAALLVRGRFMS